MNLSGIFGFSLYKLNLNKISTTKNHEVKSTTHYIVIKKYIENSSY